MNNEVVIRDSLEKCRALIPEAVSLCAVINERRDNETRLLEKVGQAKHRLELQPHVQSVLDNLQWRLHERGVGLYEKFLTSIVQDVLPEVTEPVTLDLGSERGIPSLTIQLGHGEDAEDFWDGNGGSLSNVVSAGLRFIALARSSLRQFIVLDEPDCWMKSTYVPSFVSVMDEMAKDMGVQTILVTHHPLNLVSGFDHHIFLERDPALGVRVSYPKGKPVWDPEQKGIRSIRLQNVMRHVDSHLCLAPTGTLLSGDNLIGKSVVGVALRAVAHNSSTDKLIRKRQDKAVITLELENGLFLEYVRVRKVGAGKDAPKAKVTYTLLDSTGTVIHKSRGERGDVPQWAKDILNMDLLDGLDVQLHHQKMPVFLLDQPATKQAAILSAGLESSHVRTMMALYRERIQADRGIVKQGESELSVLRGHLAMLDSVLLSRNTSLDAICACLKELETAFVSLERSVSEDATCEQLAKQWQKLRLVTNSGNKLSPLPAIPELEDDAQMRSLGCRWVAARGVATQTLPGQVPEIPSLSEFEALPVMAHKWSATKLFLSSSSMLCELPKIPEITFDELEIGLLAEQWGRERKLRKTLRALPVLVDVPLIDENGDVQRNIGQQWAQARKNREALFSEEVAITVELEKAKETIGELVARNPECPLCHGKMEVGKLLVSGGDEKK